MPEARNAVISSGIPSALKEFASRSPSLGSVLQALPISYQRRLFSGTRRSLLLVTLVIALRPVAAHSVGTGDCARLVDIGGGRKIYLECRGAGSPTVVFISGTRGAHDDWIVLMDTTGPAGARKPSESAVFPQVSRFTQVCAYDRPGTTLLDDKQTDSTPVRQPTTAQQGVADLHALLIAAKEPGPYVLVGHSWGGLITRLFASTYPGEVPVWCWSTPPRSF